MPTQFAPVLTPRPRVAMRTPDRIAAAMLILLVLAIGSGVLAMIAIGQVRAAVQTIGLDAEPSVVAAQVIRAHLAGMDSEAITDAIGENAAATGTSAAFRDHLATVDDLIVTASRNITYGEAEAGPLRALVGDLGRYLESLGETRWMARDDPTLAVARAHWSSRLLNDFAMADAAALEQANLAPLEHQYAAYRADSLSLAAVALGGFATVLIALIATQIFLLRRTRRLLNLPLAAATILTIVAMAGFGVATTIEREDVRLAKQDAFDSIHALYGAKAIALALNAERSMWLLDPAGRVDAGTRFARDLRSLLAVDLGDVKATSALIDTLNHAADLERAGRPAEAIAATPRLGGLLGDELGNITFGPAERQPATDVVVALLNYLQADQEIRRLERASRHAEAVALATSTRPGSGRATFAAMEDALDRTIAVNEREFRGHTNSAIALLGWLPWATIAALVATMLLATAGLFQRWREYR